MNTPLQSLSLAIVIACTPLASMAAWTAAPIDPIPTAASESLKAQLEELAQLEAEQQQLLRTLRERIAFLSLPPPPSEANSSESRKRRDIRAEVVNKLLDIERRVNERAEVRILSASNITPWTPLRDYFVRQTRQIEAYGTEHFPSDGKRKFYGQVILLFTLQADGRIAQIQVLDASTEFLSQHAVRILRELEPFEPFPPDIRRETDQIVFGVPFTYSKDERREALSVQPLPKTE